MAPVGLLPEHDDESWLIAEIVDFAKSDGFPKIPHYVVHPKDSPVVQKVVPKASILDWVSPRVLEAFEFQEGIKRDTEEDEKEKKKQELKKRSKNGKKRGRPFKNLSASELKDQSGMDTRETSVDPLADDAYAIQNLFPRQPSLSQPSFSQTTLSLKRKIESSIVDKSTESTEDETGGSMGADPPAAKRSRMGMNREHTRKSSGLIKELISSQTQKNIAPALPPARRSESMDETNTETKPSNITKPQSTISTLSPSSLSNGGTGPGHRATKLSQFSNEAANAPTSQRSLRDRSSRPYFGRPIRTSRSISVTNTGSPMKRPSTPASTRYSTRSSSIAVPPTSLQSPSKKPGKPFPSKPTNSASQKTSKYFPATPCKAAPSKKPSRANKANDQDVETEQKEKKDWAVIKLLDDKLQMVRKRHQRVYLVQWAGGYEPTWEKWNGISRDLINDYKRRKWREAAMPVAGGGGRSTQASAQAASAEAAENTNNSSLFVSDEDEDNNGEQQAASAEAAENTNNSSLFVTDDEKDDYEWYREQQAGSDKVPGRANPTSEGVRVKREESEDQAPVVPDYSHEYSPPVPRFLREMADAEEAAEEAEAVEWWT